METTAPFGPDPFTRRVKLTLYYVASQPCPDRGEVAMPKCGGGAVALVSRTFLRSASMEGSARLCDGRVVGVKNVAPVCFVVSSAQARAPWGVTASGRPAVPFRSIAVDPRVVPLGAWYYVPELDGLALPSPREGERHDGCVRADDVGGGIKGDVIDLFIGPQDALKSLERPLSQATVTLTSPRGRRCDTAPPCPSASKPCEK